MSKLAIEGGKAYFGDELLYIPDEIKGVVEYVEVNKLESSSKIRLNKNRSHRHEAPIIELYYKDLFDKAIKDRKGFPAKFFCKKTIEDGGPYSRLYIYSYLDKNEKDVVFQLWEVIEHSNEIKYCHFIKDLDSNIFTHFDLAKHIHCLSLEFDVKDLPKGIYLESKEKYFRNDSNLSEEHIFEITKRFFTHSGLIEEFYKSSD